jgi:hypothetical protein
LQGPNPTELISETSQLQFNRDDHLEAAKTTLEKVSAEASAEYGTVNEAAAAAETEAGSEEWALLF